MRRVMKLHPIGRETFRTRIRDNFSNGYLTLLSMVQGVAFGILVTNISSSFHVHNLQLFQAILPFFSFLGVILVFYYYSWFVSVVYAPPDLIESAIPLLLAGAEVAPMYFFGQPDYWWLLSGVFYLTGAAAFWNTTRLVERNAYEEDFHPAIKVLRLELWSNIALCLVAAGLAWWAWDTYPQEHGPTKEVGMHGMYFSICLCLIILFMAAKTQLWFLRKIYDIGGIWDKET